MGQRRPQLLPELPGVCLVRVPVRQQLRPLRRCERGVGSQREQLGVDAGSGNCCGPARKLPSQVRGWGRVQGAKAQHVPHHFRIHLHGKTSDANLQKGGQRQT